MWKTSCHHFSQTLNWSLYHSEIQRSEAIFFAAKNKSAKTSLSSVSKSFIVSISFFGIIKIWVFAFGFISFIAIKLSVS